LLIDSVRSFVTAAAVAVLLLLWIRIDPCRQLICVAAAFCCCSFVAVAAADRSTAVIAVVAVVEL